ncbi:MAG TPA: Ig-like domain-containing protein [Rhizobacter sp.]|nr:Ig-like domain-containing protein [Rhizobacter sp.]
MHVRPFKSSWRLGLGGVAGALLLSACGGGLYLGFDDFDDNPPRVDVAVDPTSAQAGQSVRVIASASDDESGVDWVYFYRLDDNLAVRIGDDGRAPYEATMLVPSDGRSSVRVFARAYDFAGNRADSAVVTLTVTP